MPAKGHRTERDLSETPAKMAVDDDVGEGTQGEPTSAERGRRVPAAFEDACYVALALRR